MRKIPFLFMIPLICLLLSGCASTPAAPVASPTPIVVEAPEIEATGQLAQAAQALLDPYEQQLHEIALQCQYNLTYTIPGDMLNTFVLDTQETGAQPANGRYQFIWHQSGQHIYQVSGQDVEEELAESAADTPEHSQEDAPMYQNAGDSQAAGGGNFDRSRAYDVAADLSQGTIEITDLLNGDMTGHEFFSFSHRNGALYFVDAALDFAVGTDGLEGGGNYLVAAGIIQKDSVEIVEYYVTDASLIPDAQALDIRKLLHQATPVSQLSAKGSSVTVK